MEIEATHPGRVNLDVTTPGHFDVSAPARAEDVTTSDGPGQVNLEVNTPTRFDVTIPPRAVDVTVGDSPAAVSIVVVPGLTGPVAPPPIMGEHPAGAIDGDNQTFTLAHTYEPGSINLYLNGLREFVDDAYIEMGDQSIFFIDPPVPGDSIRVDYYLHR